MRKPTMRELMLTAAFLAAAGAAGGCASAFPRRAMAIEVRTEEGMWRLDGVESASLDAGDWAVSVSETAISDLGATPYLERFVLAVTNTSDTRPLYLRPQEIFLTGMDRRALWLGPPEPMTIAPGRRITLTYDKGHAAPQLLYPFIIDVTVFAAPDGVKPQSVKIRLY